MMKETVNLTEITIGDKMDFWGEIKEVKEVEISKSGKTIRFKFDDGKFSTWWRVNNKVEIIREEQKRVTTWYLTEGQTNWDAEI